MTPGIGSSARRCAVTIALIAAVVNAFHVHAQEQDEAFKAGLDARKNARWPEAAEQFLRASQVQGQEATRKVDRNRVGLGGTEYLPYFFLGEALFRLERCGEALREWERSEDQGVVQKVREHYDTLREGYKTCEARGVLLRQQYQASLALSRQQVEEANKLAKDVIDLGNKHLDNVWRADPTREARYKAAYAEIEGARQARASAEKTRLDREFKEVADLAARARKTLTQLKTELDNEITRVGTIQTLTANAKQRLTEVEQLWDEVRTRKISTESLNGKRDAAEQALTRARSRYSAQPSNEASLRSAIDAAREGSEILKQMLTEFDEIDRLAEQTRIERAYAAAQHQFKLIDDEFALLELRMTERPGKVRPEDFDAASSELRRWKRGLAAARQKGDAAAIERASTAATGLLPRLTAMLERFGPVTLEERGVPAWLQSGASLFLQGEYDKSLAALDSTLESAGSWQLHVHLLRAAALHALFVRSGETNQAYRTRALNEIDACKLIDPDFQPGTGAFSPRFIAFYQNGAAPEAQP